MSSDTPDAPDYKPVAAASEKSAQLAADLGNAQLDESKRQYDNNMAVAAPVAQAQLGLMNQTQAQGNDSFNYMKDYSRPVEQSLYYESMGFTPDEIAQIESSRAQETQTYNAGKLAYQNEMVPTTSYVPSSSVKTIAPKGAIKGSDISGNIQMAGAPTDKLDNRYLQNYGMNTFFANGSGLSKNTPANTPITADPNSYYVKNADGTYNLVNASTETTNGQKAVTIDAKRGDDGKYAMLDTPATAALTSKLAAEASARMAAKDAAERGGINDINTTLANRIGETDAQVYERNKLGIDAETDAAVADARNGSTNAINMAARQGLRYGFSPEKLAAAAGAQSTQLATAQAAAANNTRKAATQTMYQRGVSSTGQSLTGATTLRQNRIQDVATATAKKLDVAGLYKGLSGASQGAYGLSINAGNSAVQNNAQAGNSLLQANQGAAGTIMQGQQTKLNGLTGILNSQGSIYNANTGSGDSTLGTIGGVVGGVVGAVYGGPAGATAGYSLGSAGGTALSDESVKKEIKPISDNAMLEGIKKTGISRWKYDKNKVQEGELADVDNNEHVGAMAKDLQKNLGDQVSDGHRVDLISAIGATMAATKALAKQVDKLKGKR